MMKKKVKIIKVLLCIQRIELRNFTHRKCCEIKIKILVAIQMKKNKVIIFHSPAIQKEYLQLI